MVADGVERDARRSPRWIWALAIGTGTDVAIEAKPP